MEGYSLPELGPCRTCTFISMTQDDFLLYLTSQAMDAGIQNSTVEEAEDRTRSNGQYPSVATYIVVMLMLLLTLW